jgi:hypothetical protein
VLQRICAFTAPFDASAAAAVAGYEPVGAERVSLSLARLTLIQGSEGSRDRVFEAVRQFGRRERSSLDSRLVHERKLSWAISVALSLADTDTSTGSWCGRVDEVVDDLRSAADWGLPEVSRAAPSA